MGAAVILEITDALVDVIHQATPDLGTWVVLHSLSQGDTAPPDKKGIFALIAVEEHEYMRNRPLVEGSTGLVRAPLFLKLHYLATYLGDPAEAQLRLGRIVQAFHTTPILRSPDLPPPLAGQVDSVAIRLVALSHEQRNMVWGALGRAGRVSLFYEVDVAPVPVLERQGYGRVSQHRTDYVTVP
jgi:hypothetical protein